MTAANLTPTLTLHNLWCFSVLTYLVQFPLSFAVKAADMHPLNLSLPSDLQDPDHFGLDTNPNSVADWLGSLPLANVEYSAAQILQLLVDLNSTRFDPLTRYQYLIQMLADIEKLVETLRQDYQCALLPLSPRNQSKYQLSVDLSNAMALGFRIVVKDLEHSVAQREYQPLLVTSLYLALFNLSQVLTDHYLAYFPAPPNLWRIINELYQFAEHHELAELSIPSLNHDATRHSVSYIYKCVILLAVTNPYHLMYGEVEKVKQIILEIASACRLLLVHPDHPLTGNLTIDLKRDSAPRIWNGSPIGEASSPRKLEITPLIALLDEKLKTIVEIRPSFDAETLTLEDIDAKPTPALRLSDRLTRDMIKRVLENLTLRKERGAARNAILGKIHLVLGLSSCHFHLSQEEAFTPELDEVRIHTGKSTSKGSQLSLIPMDFQPWQSDDSEHRLEVGIAKPRTATFQEEPSALDLWHKVYASNAEGGLLAKENEIKRLHALSTWTQKNVSPGGMCVFCQAKTTLPVRVGELLAYSNGESGKWSLGLIRWLRVQENNVVEAGIMHLVDSAFPVAARSIKGTGQGSDYFRCLLVDADCMKENNSIFLPTAVFDSGTELVINFGTRLHYLVLNEALLTTKSVSQFRYTVIGEPSVETESILLLKRLM